MTQMSNEDWAKRELAQHLLMKAKRQGKSLKQVLKEYFTSKDRHRMQVIRDVCIGRSEPSFQEQAQRQEAMIRRNDYQAKRSQMLQDFARGIGKKFRSEYLAERRQELLQISGERSNNIAEGVSDRQTVELDDFSATESAVSTQSDDSRSVGNRDSEIFDVIQMINQFEKNEIEDQRRKFKRTEEEWQQYEEAMELTNQQLWSEIKKYKGMIQQFNTQKQAENKNREEKEKQMTEHAALKARDSNPLLQKKELKLIFSTGSNDQNAIVYSCSNLKMFIKEGQVQDICARQESGYFREKQDWPIPSQSELQKLTSRPTVWQPTTPTFVALKQQEKEEEEEQERNYNLVDFEKVKHIYSQVKSSWLEAQRKIEIEQGVKENERLSKYIQVKHLNGKNVCVDLPQPKKEQIQKMAEAMGAKIHREVVDNCFLISIKNDTEKVKMAKQANNVKVLTPKFIEQCKQCDSLLNELDFLLPLKCLEI